MFLQIGRWKHNITPKITLQQNIAGITIVVGIISVYYKSSIYPLVVEPRYTGVNAT